MNDNRINGYLVRSIREFDRGMENSYDNLMQEFRSQIRRVGYRVADSASMRVNEDIVVDFLDEEFSHQFDKEVDRYISGMSNTISKEVNEYVRLFNQVFSSDSINNADLNNVNNKFRSVYSSITNSTRRSPNFSSLFDDVEYEFRRRFNMDEDMVYAFRHQFEAFREEVESEIRTEINRSLNKMAGELNQINKDAIAVLQQKQKDQLKDISESLEVDATIERITGLIDLAEGVVESITEYNNDIPHSTHSFHIRNSNNIIASLQDVLSKVNQMSSEEEKKAFLVSRVQILPKLEATLDRYLTSSTVIHHREVDKRQQEERARIQREEQERQREAERLREEQEREAERLRQQQEREAERLRQHQEREAERLRQEQEEEAERLRQEQAAERRRQEIIDFRNEHPEYTTFTNGRDKDYNQDLQGRSSEAYADHFIKLAELGTVNEILADINKINQIIAYDGDRHVFGSFIDMVNEGLKKGTVTSDELEHFRSGAVVDSLIDLDKTTRMYSDRRVYISEKMDKLAYLIQLEDEPSIVTSLSRPEIIQGLRNNDRDYTYWTNSYLDISKEGLETLCDLYRDNGLVSLSSDLYRRNQAHSNTVLNPSEVEKQRVEAQNKIKEEERLIQEASSSTPVGEEQVEEVVEEVVEELHEDVVEEVVEELQEDVIEEVVEQVVEEVQVPVVEETGLTVVEQPIIEEVNETGLVVSEPVMNVSPTIQFEGLTPQRVVASRRPIALIGDGAPVVEEVQEVLEEDVISLDEEEVVVDNTPFHSAKAEKMRKVIDSKKATYDKRATLAVLAAAGLGGASLIAGLPVTIPLIAAGVAVVSVGGHLHVNIREFAGRKANEFSLSTMALLSGCELEYVDGKLKFCGKNGADLTEKQKEKLQKKLDKKYKNKYREVKSPTLIQEHQFGSFDKVTIDNLNAAYDEFGGIKLEEVEALISTVNGVEVDLGGKEQQHEQTEQIMTEQEETLIAAEIENGPMQRDAVPSNTSVITRIINGENVEVVQGEVITEEEPEVEVEEDIQYEESYEHQVDQDLINASQLLQSNVDNAVGEMNQSNINAISTSCVDMFNGISDIFYNNKIENNEQLTALPMHKFNDDVRKINDDLMTSIKNHFDNINRQAMMATDKLMQLPNENKAEIISNLQNAYLKHATVSGMMKDLSSNFDLLLSSICNEYGISKDSKAYSELVELMREHETKIESNMYNQLIQFSNVNAMAISTVFNTFGYKEDLSESRSRGM